MDIRPAVAPFVRKAVIAAVSDVHRIPLYGRDGTVRAHALVDHDDMPLVDRYRWYLDSNGYVRTSKRTDGSTAFLLHRMLLGLPTPADNRQCDHINGDTLDNRRSNLRVVTHAENMQNRRPHRNGKSSYRGVYYEKDRDFWVAQVRHNGSKVRRRFRTELEAAEAAAQMRAELLPFAVK